MSEIKGNSILICNLDREEELNRRLAERNIPSKNLQPLFNTRPQATKYTYLPFLVQDPCKTSYSSTAEPYSVEGVFNPGTSKAPWSGYIQNVNKESILRNQIFALQNDSRAAYIPSSDSDLYATTLIPGNDSTQPFPNLFKQENFGNFDPNIANLGKSLFNNCTRQQLKENQ